MSPEQLRRLLTELRAGSLSVEEVEKLLTGLPFADVEHARVDLHRAVRQGVSEVVYAEGKSTAQVLAIADKLLSHGQSLLATRLSAEQADALQARYPDCIINPVARTARLRGAGPLPMRAGKVAVVTAGTSDLPVAEEAAETLAACGVSVERLSDVGVAGLHRLLPEVQSLQEASVLIVVAGMEGALASVVGGLVRVPVVAVPTSVGYGAAFQGVAALLGMLTSCASGITCVNIDNGFGAAMAAVRILDQITLAARSGASAPELGNQPSSNQEE